MKLKLKTYVVYTSKREQLKKHIFKPNEILDTDTLPKTIDLTFDKTLTIDIEVKETSIDIVMKPSKGVPKIIKTLVKDVDYIIMVGKIK